MLVKRLSAMLMVTLFAGAGFAQTIYVAKCAGTATCDERAQYTSIQRAVNLAQPGTTIEILDTEIYDEQVTIDGRDPSPWAGAPYNVVGGKTNLTLLFKPSAANPLARPTIRYRDITNTSPATRSEAGVEGELPGQAGNFETNGALRILHAKYITIDGIAVDGRSAFTFGATGIWADPKDPQKFHPIFHGNSAIAVTTSGDVIIRNSHARNAYFGIYIKDRNTGGVFGNKNPGDNDFTVPLSAFGKVGNHLIEHNRVHNNNVGFFFESAWDLGSTVRYNLIFNNYLTVSQNIETENQNGGAFLFKDMYLTPLAIYNNTLHNNSGNFQGNWQIGGQHLIFNNIFSRSRPAGLNNPAGTLPGALPNPSTYMTIDGRFPNRMHNNSFSATANVGVDCNQQTYNCAANAEYMFQNPATNAYCMVNNVQMEGMPEPSRGSAPLVNCQYPSQTQNQQMVLPGAAISGGTELPIPVSAGLKWLQVDGWGNSMPPLFLSMDQTSPNFLVPDWTNPHVAREIKNSGWGAANGVGIRNSDGNITDLGAIPSTGRQQTTLARIRPLEPVLISNGQANVTVRLDAYSGTIENPRISFLRWIAPIPENNVAGTNDWANNFQIIPATSIRAITPPTGTVNYGTTRFTFPVTGTVPKYGFFEMVLTGKDQATGVDVTSDVAFLPYRELLYTMNVSVHEPGSSGSNGRLLTVTAGEPVRLYVTASQRNPTTGALTPFTQTLDEVSYNLTSDPMATMLCNGNCPPNATNLRPLTEDNTGVAGTGKSYEVIFWKAGTETISSAGVYFQGTGANRTALSFFGISDTILVKPGVPAKVAWKDPISKSLLDGALPDIIFRGATGYEAQVEVQDRFGNAVDVSVPVDIVSLATDIGDAGSPADITTKRVSCSAATGVATFRAVVTNGNAGQIFDMVATLVSNSAKDTAALRISRVFDYLAVFYADTGNGGPNWRTYHDESVEINATVGEWHKVTIKAVSQNEEAYDATKAGCVQITPDHGLVVSATDGGAPTTTVNMVNGVASFWVSSSPDLQNTISGACVEVTTLLPGCATVDNSIQSGSRCGITFTKPEISIYNAVVSGDGNGRPTTVDIRYSMEGNTFTGPGAQALPDSVTLRWPTRDGARFTVHSSAVGAITALNDTTVRVNFVGATAAGVPFATGYTNTPVGAQSWGMVTVYGGYGGSNEGSDMFDVLDGIGMVLAGAPGEAIPNRVGAVIVENLSGGTLPDTLIVQLSEERRDPGGAANPLAGGQFVYTTTDPDTTLPATGGVALDVARVEQDFSNENYLNRYKLILALGSPAPAPGNWVRFAPTATVTDIAANINHDHPDNNVHINNRWVQVVEKQMPSEAIGGYYTSTDSTGKLDYAYIQFNKAASTTWFQGAAVTFDNRTLENPVSNIFIDPLTPDVVRFDLSAIPHYRDNVVTGGTINANITFDTSNPILGTDWLPTGWPLSDRARPVLAAEVVITVGIDKDKIELIFSEQISPGALASKNPVIIYKPATGVTIPDLSLTLEGSPVPHTVNGMTYYKVTYTLDTRYDDLPENVRPATGNLVYINRTGGIEDIAVPSNTQTDPNNLRQRLKIESPLLWTITLGPNPARTGNAMKVVIDSKRAGTVDVEATVKLYNNMGNIVRSWDYKDTKKMPNFVEFEWDGTNSKGRLVGTGTYLMIIKARALITNEDGTQEWHTDTYSKRHMVGFVRGKKN